MPAILMKFSEEQYRQIVDHCNAVYLPPTTWCKSVIAKALEGEESDED